MAHQIKSQDEEFKFANLYPIQTICSTQLTTAKNCLRKYMLLERSTKFSAKKIQAITITCHKNKENGLGRDNDKSF